MKFVMDWAGINRSDLHYPHSEQPSHAQPRGNSTLAFPQQQRQRHHERQHIQGDINRPMTDIRRDKRSRLGRPVAIALPALQLGLPDLAHGEAGEPREEAVREGPEGGEDYQSLGGTVW